LKFRIDIISNDIPRWLLSNSKYQLPSFDYYLENCVKNKGGNYDFTIRRYKTHLSAKQHNVSNASLKRSVNVNCFSEHSIWMGTPFNFKDTVIVS
jgi:hypothetical protein